MEATPLERLKDLKQCADGQSVSVRAQVLRLWEWRGQPMCLIGDSSGLVRLDLGPCQVEEGRSYKFEGLTVQSYPGGWHSLRADADSAVLPEAADVVVAASPEYVEKVYRILQGVERKRLRRATRSQLT